MRKLYLHIGTEKTGTTSIQKFLAKNSPSLLSMHGILYPTHPVLFHNNAHFPVAATFLDSPNCDFVVHSKISTPAKISQTLKDEYEKYKPQLMLLSAEHFSSRFQEKSVAMLAQMLTPFHITIVVYVRRQDSMALSSFSTAVLTGRRNWFDIAEILPNSPQYNILNMLSIWANHFGREQIQLRIYDNNTAKDMTLISNFMTALGVENLSGLTPVGARNQSISAKQVKFLSELNRRLPTWHESVTLQKKENYYQANRVRMQAVKISQE